jgi:hypothetical protein
MRRAVVGGVFNSCLCISLALAAAAENVKVIRTVAKAKSQTGDHYYLIFAARGGSPTGHAFVMWAEETEDNASSSYEGYGFYPEENTSGEISKTVLGPVPGRFIGEAKNHSWPLTTDRLVVEVDRSFFEISQLALQAAKQRPPMYQPIASDCVTFLEDVAKSIGLNAPPRTISTLLPQAYVRALINSVDAPQHVTLPNGYTWDGPIVFNIPSGKGTWHYEPGLSYTGEVILGQRDGHGTFFGPGVRVEGEFSGGKLIQGTYYLDHDKSTLTLEPSGRETANFSDGSHFTGDATVMTEGNGHGSYEYPDGSSFDGDFRSGSATKGLLKWPDGTTFDGTFENNRPRNGKYSGSDGITYQGPLLNGQPQGYGHWEKGDEEYRGDFNAGVRSGSGILSFASGVMYDGQFANGFPNGHGTLTGASDEKYVGDFANGHRQGHGIITFADGSKYEGQFTSGVANGPGVYTDGHGTQTTENWSNGSLQPTPPSNGNDHPVSQSKDRARDGSQKGSLLGERSGSGDRMTIRENGGPLIEKPTKDIDWAKAP